MLRFTTLQATIRPEMGALWPYPSTPEGERRWLAIVAPTAVHPLYWPSLEPGADRDVLRLAEACLELGNVLEAGRDQ